VLSVCRIVIVGGGGTIGSSTALWLARRGYTDVHILDMLPIPSAHSAGNDLNKVCACVYAGAACS
jgi:sarcosine oxidase/L-pipecolate oxidase